MKRQLISFVVLMAAALSHHLGKSGLSRNIGIGLLFTFVFYAVIKLGLLLGEYAVMPPLIAAWLGTLVCGLTALFMFWRSVRL